MQGIIGGFSVSRYIPIFRLYSRYCAIAHVLHLRSINIKFTVRDTSSSFASKSSTYSPLNLLDGLYKNIDAEIRK